MLARIAAWLGVGSDALPADLVESIEGARVLPRSRDPESGFHRVAVALAGRGLRAAFVFNRETAAEKIAARWPELTKQQTSRAVDFLQAHVERETARMNAPSRKKSGWVHNW